VQNHPGESLGNSYARLFAFIDKNELDRLKIDLRVNDGATVS
jgi:hypothetical protein